MPYVGRSLNTGEFKVITLSESFDNSRVDFTMSESVGNVNQLIVILSGVVQHWTDAFTVSGTTLTFSSAPSNGETIKILKLGDTNDIGVPSDASVTADKLASTLNLSSKTLTLPASSVTAHVTQFDDSAIRADISALALREATNETSAAFNLPNSFVDTFTDDTNLGTQTTVDRISGYISSIWSSANAFAPAVKEIATPSGTAQTSSWTGGGVTNDHISNGAGSYAGSGIDYGFDLSQDFTLRTFWVDSSGNSTSKTYQGGSMLITTDTSKSAGASPSNLWDTVIDGSANYQPTPSDWGDVLDDTYASAISVTGFTDNSHSGASDQSYNISSGNAVVRQYANSGTAYSGWELVHTSSSNTITLKAFTAGSFTSLSGDGEITVTNVPSSGRLYFAWGDAAGGGTAYMSTTYNGGSTATYSSVTTASSNATGTLIQSANTVGSAKTEVSGTMIYKDNAGTATLGTDLKIYFTCNGGSNWTEAASYNAITPVYATGIKQVRLGKTTCTSGTDIRYKAVWANQASGSKETQLHGISINY